MQAHRLHEVRNGGISSFSLVNMMVAHLMAEGYRLAEEPEQEANQFVNQDLGHLLWGFLFRFGTVFDYYDQAVSIIQVIPSPCALPSSYKWDTNLEGDRSSFVEFWSETPGSEVPVLFITTTFSAAS